MWTARGFRRGAANVWTARGQPPEGLKAIDEARDAGCPQPDHTNPPAAHTAPGHVGWRTTPIQQQVNVLEEQKMGLKTEVKTEVRLTQADHSA